jgi:hypothetical protein
MTNSTDVKAEVLRMVQKSLEPGYPVTPKAWRMAYDMVRAQAIADTIMWKQCNVTITLRGGH